MAVSELQLVRVALSDVAQDLELRARGIIGPMSETSRRQIEALLVEIEERLESVNTLLGLQPETTIK